MVDPVAELDERFSEPDAAPPPWSEVVHILSRSEMFWLSTVRRTGQPHVTPIPAMWLDGALHFCTGAEEQKARNLAFDARCVLTTGTSDFRSGIDVVVEGTAARVTEGELLLRLAAMWKAKLDWDFEVVNEGFQHPGGGAGALVFGVTPDKILAFGKGQPYSQTRYRLPAG
ncbi:general stress protein 26 [Lipingzhangella halophila]|uniref:General stress protein 26 n=1 Tax=Lipingzhangella halophila TaxID=1783352 RepID=A0A7W7RL63_9ACTN|nr:pyridoxamine 5'-phosphate oxidase family protein [Lipingzhangella halophila]MBB4934024.1 general stress protein 26 [Lipingzhangella halophila]